jgi:hypothetical protein
MQAKQSPTTKYESMLNTYQTKMAIKKKVLKSFANFIKALERVQERAVLSENETILNSSPDNLNFVEL